MKRNNLLIVCLLLISISCLKLKQNHRAGIAYSNISSLLTGLQNQQAQFQTQVKVLDQDLTNTVKSVTDQNDIRKKLQILQKGIQQQQDDIFVASTKIIPKLVLKDQCQSITQTQKQSLIQKTTNTITKLKQILQKLNTLPQDARIIELKANCNHQIYYLQTINQFLTENCTSTATLSSTAYQSNIYAENWATGTMTIDEIVKQYILRSQQFNQITNCPLSKPFYDGTQCINCEGDRPIFNMATRKCFSCAANQYFNIQQRNCKVKVQNATNPAFYTNTIGVIPILDKNKDVICNEKTPYYNGVKCIACENLFDFDTKSCTSCPVNTIYVKTQRKCLVPDTTNQASANKVIGNITKTQNSVFCPVNTPFFNGKECISCPELFSLKTLQCTKCAQNQKYDEKLKDCVALPPNYSNLNDKSTYIGTPPQKPTNPILCPMQKPFLSKQGCKDCKQTNYLFSFQTQQCIACPTGNVYNFEQKKCVVLKPNTSNKQNATLTTGTAPAVPANPVECPPATPYFNKEICVACDKTKPVFDYKTFTCIPCQTGKVYDEKLNQCIVPKPNTSNKKNATLTTGTAPAVPANPVQCPSATPYFNKETCVACDKTKPVFDYKTFTCIPCEAGKFYDEATNMCLAEKPNTSNKQNATLSTGTPPPVPANPVECPPAQPYFNKVNCVACDKTKPVFDYKTFTCVLCETGKVYDEKLNQCIVPKPNTSNKQNGTLTIGTAPAVPANPVECPPATPYFNKEICVACDKTKPVFDYNTFTCVPCQTGKIYDQKLNQCIVPKPNTTNFQAGTLYIGQKPSTLPPNAILCQQKTPYFDGTNCISCPSTQPYFDLATKKCRTCQGSYQYIASNHSCQLKKPKFSNQKGLTSSIGPLTTGKPEQSCLELQPFFTQKSGCIACPQTTPIFDATKQQCINCQNGFYNKQKRSCQYYNASNPQAQNTIGGIPQIQNANYCPKDVPFYNVQTKTCFACNLNEKYYQVASGKCINCPTGTIYYQTTLDCRTPTPNATNPTKQALAKTIGELPPSKTQDILCKQDTPYYIGDGKCISCSDPLNPYFDVVLKTCRNCHKGQIYDPNSHKCNPVYVSDLSSGTWVSNDPYRAVVLNTPNQNKTLCPSTTPYYNGAVCISCPTSPYIYFDVDQKVCVGCREGTTFNKVTHKCEVAQTLLKTNYLAGQKNIIITTQSTYPKRYWKQTLAADPASQCPAQLPYYNGVQCILCPPQLPYFNMELKACVRCSPTNIGTLDKNGQCLKPASGEAINTSLQALMSNVFRHHKVQ